MRRKAPILVEPLAADRATDLLGAGCADSALILMEAQAGGIVVEPERTQQGAHFAFGIIDQLLVDNTVDGTGLDAVEMRHKPDIVGIILPEVAKVVAERLAAREMLLEVGEAAGERVATRVDK